ncbi:NON-SPECIFIC PHOSPHOLIPASE C4-RELATED [Salix purpurea]|uniref:NON-SPECIFIC PHOSPHOLIPASE C4-RELATED n=1 Tax=Salix purpurea TaxID=77065 RepID=A0A9Q0PPC7_SALPP|nr:NON-SPECIFIC PHOSPHOLIPASE C4-RELATED [Salix purpurea]
MENRSFDHVLGWLKSTRPDIDGLTGSESNRISVSDSNADEIFVSDDAVFVDSDPGHSFQAIREQIFGSNDSFADPAPMSGFAQQAKSMSENMSKIVMSGFKPSRPNRLYVHSATSHGAMSNVRKDLIHGFPQKTIFDSLDENGLSFGVYYQNIPATLFLTSLRKLKHALKFHSYELKFKLHAKLGKLPNYVVVEQRYFDVELFPANDDHPSHDVARGQRFVKEVYETLRSSPQWKEMALLITYDEHGGFYDHVPTPVRGVPNPDGIIGSDPYYFQFNRLGVRVPTLLISPWIDKGTVIHEPVGPRPSSQFEHSSIPATVKKLFNLKSNFLTRRDAWAGSFENYFYLRDTPRDDCPAKLRCLLAYKMLLNFADCLRVKRLGSVQNVGPYRVFYMLWPGRVLISVATSQTFIETLPEVTASMRPWGPKEDASLTEFQVEMIQLASQLNGDYVLTAYPDIGKSMTVGEANRYAEDAVRRFLEASRAALRAGANESTIVTMRPSLTSRIPAAGGHGNYQKAY